MLTISINKRLAILADFFHKIVTTIVCDER